MFDDQLETPTIDAPDDTATQAEATADTGDAADAADATQAQADDEATAPEAESDDAATAASDVDEGGEVAEVPDPGEGGEIAAATLEPDEDGDAGDAGEGATAEVEAPQADAPVEAEADAGSDDEDTPSIAPEVQEYVGQDTTVLHEVDTSGPIRTDFRTPPGIASGLDPGLPEERDAGPGGSS